MQRVFWFLLLATVIWAVGMQVEMRGYLPQQGRSDFPSRCESNAPVIAQIELARDPACFANLIAVRSLSQKNDVRAHNLKLAVWNTYADFVFILLYWLTFLAFAKLLWATSGRAGWLAIAVAILITAAALLDVWEDWLMLRGFHHVCEGNLDFWPSGAVSAWKWCVLGLATVVLGVFCFAVERRVLRKMMAGLLMVSGVVTMTGTLMCADPGPGVSLLFLGLVWALVCYFPRVRGTKAGSPVSSASVR